MTERKTKLNQSPCSSCFFYESEWNQSDQEDEHADQFSGLCDFHDKWVDHDDTCEDHEPMDNTKDNPSDSVDLRVRDEDGYVTNENRCDSCDGDGYHVTEIGTDYICDHCNGSGLLLYNKD